MSWRATLSLCVRSIGASLSRYYYSRAGKGCQAVRHINFLHLSSHPHRHQLQHQPHQRPPSILCMPQSLPPTSAHRTPTHPTTPAREAYTCHQKPTARGATNSQQRGQQHGTTVTSTFHQHTSSRATNNPIYTL